MISRGSCGPLLECFLRPIPHPQPRLYTTMDTLTDQITEHLRTLADPHNKEGMRRYGINTDQALGISMKTLRQIAGEHRRNHRLALNLWDSGIHEARLLAVHVDDPKALTGEQMERWVATFNSWDLCDQACSNLFDRSPLAWEKAHEWSKREKEFAKRAGFVLMAALSVHDKKAPDDPFLGFLPVIERESTDGRNYVRKAVNWALRAIGKRNSHLNNRSVELSRKLSGAENKTARWIGKDALRELTSDKVRQRLQRK